MTRWSGRWERSAMWAMRRSAESRVRESSEGGRIGPDLDLAPPFIAPSAGSKGASPSRPCHATLPSVLASRPAPHARFVLRLPAGQAQAQAHAQSRSQRRTNRRLFTVVFPINPSLFRGFLPAPPCRIALSRGKAKAGSG
jgi:hypothetical protein